MNIISIGLALHAYIEGAKKESASSSSGASAVSNRVSAAVKEGVPFKPHGLRFVDGSFERWWCDSYASEKVIQPFTFYNCISTNIAPDHSFDDIYTIILDYAGIPILEMVNDAMQDVLLKEEWDINIKSPDNWRYIERLYSQVTKLRVPDSLDISSRHLHTIISSTTFPRLNELEIGAYTLRRIDYPFLTKLFDQNPRCRFLILNEFHLEYLYYLFKSHPQITANLRSLVLKKIDTSVLPKGFHKEIVEADQKQGSEEIPKIVNVLKQLTMLSKLVLPGNQLKKEEVGRILSLNPNLSHLNLLSSSTLIPIEEFRDFIEMRKASLRFLDLSPTWDSSFKATSPGCVSLRNCISSFDEPYMFYLMSLDALHELCLSNTRIPEGALKHLLSWPMDSLKVLRMQNCNLENSIDLEDFNKPSLVELDVNGVKMIFKNYTILKGLPFLRILKCGDFHAGTSVGWGSSSKTINDYEKTEEFRKCLSALNTNNPRLNEVVLKVLKATQHYEPAPPPKEREFRGLHGL